ncbi:MAG: indole-3-glycerol-phosphate synthase, partial [Anaerolineae bacterium]|nr:indole-3-glycerol-phosphate synthase [Anaerolineae bacterium]
TRLARGVNPLTITDTFVHGLPVRRKNMVSTLYTLEEIAAYKKRTIAQQQMITPLASLRALAKMQDRPYDLSSRLRENRVALLARIMNPNAQFGDIPEGAASYDPVALARRLVRQGVQALMVATDERHHGGGIEHLTLVTSAVDVPVIRYDYIVDEYQVVETRAAGGDGILLMPELLEPAQMHRLVSATQRNLMTVVARVHNEEELRAVLPYEPRVIAIDNRDRHTRAVDLTLTSRLVQMVPGHITVITLGGMKTTRDVAQVMAGVDGVLVNQAMLLIPTVAADLREMLGVTLDTGPDSIVTPIATPISYARF